MACDYNTVQSSVYRYRNLCVAAYETHVVLVRILCQGRRTGVFRLPGLFLRWDAWVVFRSLL